MEAGLWTKDEVPAFGDEEALPSMCNVYMGSCGEVEDGE